MTSTERRAKELAKALEVAESGSDLELQILAAALAACAREARLDEAEWWEHLAPNCAKDENDTTEYTEGCMYCERLAALERAVGEKGRA